MTEETKEELSIEDTIRAAMESNMEDEGTVQDEAADEAGAPPESPESTESSEPAESPDEEDSGEDQPEAEDIAAPENWDQSRKEAFDALGTVEAKQTYLDAVKSLEKGYQTKFDELATVRKEHETIMSLIQPFEAQLQASGLDRIGGIRSLVGAQQLLSQNPQQGLTQLIQQYGGANAKAIVQEIAKQYGVGIAADDSQAYQDPEITALQDQVNNLNQTLQQNELSAQQQRMAAAQNQITLFEKAVDNDGNLMHPHFEKVKNTMSTLITGGLAPDLESAYSQAVRLDENLSAEAAKEAEKKVAEKLNIDRQKKVEESKRAAKNPKTNNKAPDSAVSEPDDVRDSVLKTLDALG